MLKLWRSSAPAGPWNAAVVHSVRTSPRGNDKRWSGVPAGISSAAPSCSLHWCTAAAHTDIDSSVPAKDGGMIRM